MAAPALATAESIEFVAEHMPEIAMDNRYATLPLWTNRAGGDADRWRLAAAAGYSRIAAGGLDLGGAMLSCAFDRSMSADSSLSLFGFFDDLSFSSAHLDRRPLDVSFTAELPLVLPSEAQFSELSGSTRHTGLGMAFRRATERKWLGRYEWTAGLMWERVALHNYTVRYQILDGRDADVRGLLDYSATYTFTTPFAGIAWPRESGNWRTRPHVQVALPLPRRGFAGRIVAAGIDARGDSADLGAKPFGDPSLTLGWDLTYMPWSLTVDVGSFASQATLERLIHEGAQRNWLVSFTWVH
ncbi:MAG TPA: hypothetical protein P5528_12475 [Steroidobacteraceae bacterium]|nr:hypothetical protein [Steroidobacteraceae bacterium]HRX90250.1 hypothetical protein [Steroidobacteraceae bacterium]